MAEQPARSGKPRNRTAHRKTAPTWRQRLTMTLMVWAATALTWLLRATCRIEIVEGAEHVENAVANGQAVVPCGWHQRIITSGLFLRSLVPRGLRIGFLISPSREGEFIARVAKTHNVEVIRGSSSRTGREAMRNLTRAVGDGISPMMYGDGPRGPAGVFKPGAVILASRSGAALFPVGCVASRYWQLQSWDTGQIPKPFARLKIAVGQPWSVGPLDETNQAEDIAERLGEQIKALDAAAEASE